MEISQHIIILPIRDYIIETLIIGIRCGSSHKKQTRIFVILKQSPKILRQVYCHHYRLMMDF